MVKHSNATKKKRGLSRNEVKKYGAFIRKRRKEMNEK